MKKYLYFIFILFSFSTSLVAQNLTETQWYFGKSTYNIQFDKNGFSSYLEEKMNADFGKGGSLVISNEKNGHLMFYTDGVKIYDASHQLINGYVVLNGNDSINQSAVGCKVPNSQNNYFVFTNSGNSGVNEIHYTEIDAGAVGNGNSFEPLGKLVKANIPTDLINPSEALAIVKGIENNYWLISQDRTNYDFRVTKITSSGIENTQVFKLHNDETNPIAEVISFVYNPTKKIIASIPKFANRQISILNFNDTTGVLTLNKFLKNSFVDDNGAVAFFDAEWSYNGSKLYVSRYGGIEPQKANIFYYDFDKENVESTKKELFSNPIYQSLGLKLGIDRKIYHLYKNEPNGATIIGKINFADSSFNLVEYEPEVFTQDFNAMQFPAFVVAEPIDFKEIKFKFFDNCQNQTTKFFPLIDPVPNFIVWDFGDGSISSDYAPTHTYTNSGGYMVTMYAVINQTVKTYSDFIEIEANNLQVDLGKDTVICVDEKLTLNAGNAKSYAWSTGENTQKIEVDTLGTYWVKISDGNCFAFDEIKITEYGNKVQISNRWYFGENAGVDFNIIPPKGIDDGNQMFAPEGCAVISNESGRTLFYTNGKNIWNGNHKIMAMYDSTEYDGLEINDIGGDNTTSQGTMILPFAEDKTLYYVFSSEEVYAEEHYNLRYSIVDLKLDSGRGGIIAKNLPLADKSTEKITASNFEENPWLITHEFGSNTFRNHRITTNGISNAIYSPSGSVVEAQSEKQAEGVIKFNDDVTLLAHLIPDLNVFEIFNFNQNNGRLSLLATVSVSENNLYGLEFSPNSNRIYISSKNKLIQFDLDSLYTKNANENIANTKFDGYPLGSNYGSLQKNATGVIYLAENESTKLLSIDNPDGNDLGASFNTSGIDLLNKKSRLGLPNFTQNISEPPQPAGIEFESPCLGKPVKFKATGTSNIDSYIWKFFDGEPSTAVGDTAEVTYSKTGKYYFEMRMTNRCKLDSLFKDTVEIFPVPHTPTVNNEETICKDKLVLEAWPRDTTSFRYYWSTGDITRQVTFTKSANIKVAIINKDGCSSDTVDVLISDNRPKLDIGNDTSICQNTNFTLDAGVSDIKYSWFVGNTPLQNNQTQKVITDDAGEYKYYLQIIEPLFQCSITDSIKITINATPKINSIIEGPSICGASDASLQFELTNTGVFNYQLKGTNLFQEGKITGPSSFNKIENLPVSNYTFYFKNLTSGCENTEYITIEDESLFDVSAINLPDCDPNVKLQVSVSGLNPPNVVNIYVLNTDNDTIEIKKEVGVPIQSFSKLEDGLYFVSVKDIYTNCVRTDTVRISKKEPLNNNCVPTIIAPTAFSPNGNGMNEDFFIFPSPFIENFEISIYSKWGDLIYHSNYQNFKWNGKVRNEYLPADTYTYVIQFTSKVNPSLGVIKQFGSLTLIR